MTSVDSRPAARAVHALPRPDGGTSAQVPGVLPAQAAASAQSASLATIDDARIARQVAQTLAKLEGVTDAPSGTPEDRIATIFFDPRCPYCHAAFTALHGKVAARWVPVVVLGDSEAGTRMAAAILSASDRVAALTAAFQAKAAGSGAPAPEIAAKLSENKEAFAGIFAASPTLRPGVPTLFVPRPDGRLAILVGYEPGDDAKVAALMTGT